MRISNCNQNFPLIIYRNKRKGLETAIQFVNALMQRELIGDPLIAFYSLQLYFSSLAYLLIIFDLLLLMVTGISEIEKFQSISYQQEAL